MMLSNYFRDSIFLSILNLIITKKLTCLWCISASKTIVPRGKKSISFYKLNSKLLFSRIVNCKALNDFYRFGKLLFVAEEVRVCAAQLHGRPSHLVTNNVITFCHFSVDWIGHHLRPCRCHHYHGNYHCHHWRFLMRDVKTLMVNISICKYLNLRFLEPFPLHRVYICFVAGIIIACWELLEVFT